MTAALSAELSTATVRQLQDLVQANIDSRDGFRHAAEAADDLTLRGAFEQLAGDRDGQANELARFLTWSGEMPRSEGSLSAAVHRIWMDLRRLASADSRYAVLCEVEREEARMLTAYEDALRTLTTLEVRDVLVRHHGSIRATHDSLRDLRCACRDCE